MGREGQEAVGAGSTQEGRGPKWGLRQQPPMALGRRRSLRRGTADSSLDCFSGNMVLHSSGPGRATACGLGMVAQAPGLPREQGHGSPQKAGGRLALRRALLLWRRQLSLCQRAT